MTLRNAPDFPENDDQFDRIYWKLQNACELARMSLPHCRTEYASRKDRAESTGQTRSAYRWEIALNKCDTLIHWNNLLLSKLKIVKLKDPNVRTHRDFWQLCDTFVQSWADLATEIKSISLQQVDITTVKTVMRPVQKAVKEVSKSISESPLYRQAAAGGSTSTLSLAPPFPPPANINTAFAQAAGQGGGSGLHSGYVTPVPATPLSAASTLR